MILLLIWSGRRHQRLLAGVSSFDLPVYSSHRSLYQGEAYSHQWPRCGERFLGRYTPEERFRGRLREWRLGERDPRCCEGPCERFPAVRPGSGMSTTVGGRSRRSKAAASGRAASMTSRVSGRAGTGQRVDNSRPLPSSFPCLSCGISQMLPRRRSREGLGRGLLKSR